MNLQLLEGTVAQGQVQLPPEIHLPENLRVYVLVPEALAQPVVHVYSPHLKNPAQITDFKMEVLEEQPDAIL